MKEFQALRTSLQESIEDLTESQTLMPPNILILRRQTVRQYPGGLMVALYFNDKLKQYFSIPYGAPGVDSTITPTSIKEEVVQEEPQVFQNGKWVQDFKAQVYKTHPTLKGQIDWEHVDRLHQKGHTPHAAAKKYVQLEEDTLNEISIPVATRAFHARQELGDKAKKKKQYRAAIYHYAKATKTLDRRAEKYKREDKGETVKEEKELATYVTKKGVQTYLRPKQAGRYVHANGAFQYFHKEASGQWEVHRNGKFTTGQVETNYPVAKKHWDERTNKNEKGDKFTLVPRKPGSPINEDAISHLQRVRAFKTSTALNHKDGSQTKVDPQTANALLTVHAAMHPDNKKKFSDALEHSRPKFHKMLDFAWKQVK